MKSAIRPLAIIIISLFGFLVIVSFYTDRSHLELTAKEMHAKVLNTQYVVSNEQAQKYPNVRFVDIRDAKAYRLAHKENSLNIPLASILSEEFLPFFLNDSPKVLFSADPADAHEAWMLLTQMGYANLFVMDIPAELIDNKPAELPKLEGVQVAEGGH